MAINEKKIYMRQDTGQCDQSIEKQQIRTDTQKLQRTTTQNECSTKQNENQHDFIPLCLVSSHLKT